MKTKNLEEENKKLREVVKDFRDTIDDAISRVEHWNIKSDLREAIEKHEQFLKGLE